MIYMLARILIVDDSPTIRELLRSQLVDEGHDVLTAPDGEAALALLRDADVDVVLLDMMLPGISGLDLLRGLRDEAPGVEVIVITAFASVEIAVDCLRAGAVDLLRKPVDRAQLLLALDVALTRQCERATQGMLHASQDVLAAREPDSLPEVIVRTAMGVMHASSATLLLPGADGCLHVAHAFGLPAEIQSQVTIALGDQVAGRIALERSPVLLQDLYGDTRFAGLEPSSRVKSSIVYPLALGDRLVGVLAFNRGEAEPPFRHADLRRASLFASLVLLALENTRLMRQSIATERLVTLGQLAASIAHEINNPLSYVLGNIGHVVESVAEVRTLMGEAGSAPRAKVIFDGLNEALSDVMSGADRIASIVRDMRAVSQAQPTDSAASCDLSEVIRSALRLTSAQLRPTAEVVLQLGERLSVRGVGGQLTQVFVNLLVNAAQAMAEAGRTAGRITVCATRMAAEVVVEVKDNGPGIRAADRARLFEPFFTTRSATTGTGLGLWISREIMLRHGGDIQVESVVGEGTTFRLRLPAGEEEAQVDAQVDASGERRAAVRRAHVLFIDDEESLLCLYVRLLGETWEVETALGGPRALELLEAKRDFDAVVCDLLMPHLNGMDLYARLRADAPALADRFIFVTGSATHRDVRDFLVTCRNPVLEKPLDVLALRTLVERRISGVQS